MATPVISQRARDDLDRIWEYIAENNVASADKVVDAILECASQVARIPRCGQPVDELGEGLRRFPVSRYPYVVYYVETGTGVEVARILHGRQDAVRQFKTND
jgi:toxin ParE1/3/4